MSVLKTSLRNFFAHKGRMILSGMAVLLSVAFVCGTLVFTATMQNTFDKLFAQSASDVMVMSGEAGSAFEEPDGTGRPAFMPASVAEEIRGVDGVAEVTGVVESQSIVVVGADNESVSPHTGAPTVGANWTDIDLRIMEEPEGSLPQGPGEVLVDHDTASSKNLEIGDQITVISVSGTFPVTISGIVEFSTTNPGAAVVYFDTATAQEVLLGADGFTTVYVDGTGAVSNEALRDSVAATVGDDHRVLTEAEYVEENRNALGEFFSIIRWVLLGFAGISLLVGIFLIVNTFTMLVAQRTREIGLFRAIGASRKQVNRSVLIEALLLGVIGSVLGFGAGVLLAIGLMALMGALGMNLSTDDLTIGASVPVIGLIVGVVVTLLAAYFPARRASRITPMAALADDGLPTDTHAGRTRAVIGGALTVLGIGALAMTAAVDTAAAAGQFLGLGVLLTLVGLVLFAPMLVGGVVKVLSAVLLRGFGSIGRMAERNALRNPRRTGATASALMIGLALVSGLAVVGSSMVASASKEIDETVGADFIVQSSTWMTMLPDVRDAVHEADHLSQVVDVRIFDGEITMPGGATVTQQFTAVDPGFPDVMRVEVTEGSLTDALRPGGVALDAGRADSHDVGVGDVIEVTLKNGEPTTLEVRALTEGGSGMGGTAAYLGTETVGESVPADAVPLPWMVLAVAADGQQEAARASLDQAMEPYPQMEVRDQSDYKQLIRDQVGQLLNLVYGLLALAIIVAILGVVNTLALSVVERTREIGLMRAIGLSRRQLRRMIRLESVVIALFGAVLGVLMGLGWGAAAQQILALEGMEVMEIPWATIITVFIGAALVGLLAALVPAFRAGRMNILNAIATE
jgi:putative ABC transport system permease protein